MPDLSVFQFNIVDNIFSMTVATMGATALFLFLSRVTVAREYRPALTVSGLVCTIACYHYFMIRHSWGDAYVLGDAGYGGSGAAFNDFYRYADWISDSPAIDGGTGDRHAASTLARQIAADAVSHRRRRNDRSRLPG